MQPPADALKRVVTDLELSWKRSQQFSAPRLAKANVTAYVEGDRPVELDACRQALDCPLQDTRVGFSAHATADLVVRDGERERKGAIDLLVVHRVCAITWTTNQQAQRALQTDAASGLRGT